MCSLSLLVIQLIDTWLVVHVISELGGERQNGVKVERGPQSGVLDEQEIQLPGRAQSLETVASNNYRPPYVLLSYFLTRSPSFFSVSSAVDAYS